MVWNVGVNLWVRKNILQIILLSWVAALNFKGAITKWTKPKPWSYVKLDIECVCIYMGIYRKTFKLERPLDGIMFMKNEPLEAKQP